jgi:hypothetical protein
MIAKPTNDATSSSAASIASSSSVASLRVTRKPPERSSPCHVLQPQGFGLKLSTRPNQITDPIHLALSGSQQGKNGLASALHGKLCHQHRFGQLAHKWGEASKIRAEAFHRTHSLSRRALTVLLRPVICAGCRCYDALAGAFSHLNESSRHAWRRFFLLIFAAVWRTPLNKVFRAARQHGTVWGVRVERDPLA